MKTRMLYAFALMAILALGSMSVQSLIPDDADGDGVPDSVDVCLAEDASFFDRDGDGCLDADLGARHTEFWGSADTLITYVINASGSPDVGDGSEFPALQAAMDAWPAIAGTELNVTYGGTSPIEDANTLDQIHLATFVDDEFPFSSLVLAVGITTSFTEATWHNGRLYRPGEIVDADMIFNPVKAFKTSTSGPGYGVDIQSVATHEAGHLYGLAHTAIRSATMSYVLPAGTAARSLETDDELAYLKAYANPATRAAANRIAGTVTDGHTSNPVSGAIVFATDVATGDTAACEYTLPDGSYTFMGLDDGSYYISIYPLNGTSPIDFIQPGNVNALVETTAVAFFVPEYYDAAESNSDNETDKLAVSVSSGTTAAANLVTNIDANPPYVVRSIPPDDSVGVAIDGAYVIKFSEGLDDATIAGAFDFTRIPDGAGVGGNIAVLSDDSVLAFTPSAPLDFNTTYQLTLDTSLEDKSGNPIGVPFVLDVTTELEPPVSISSLSPNKGVVNTTVVINGSGFDHFPVAATVTFDTVLATVTSATPNQLVVSVPEGAGTGPVTVTNPSDASVSNSLTFTLLSPVEIARGYEAGVVPFAAIPSSMTIMPDDSYAYVGTDAGAEAVVVSPAISGYLSSEGITYAGGLDGVATTPEGRRVYGVGSVNEELVEIMSDTSTGLLFNTVLSSHDLGAEPLGIAIEPGGNRAYIPTEEAEIQVWDVQLGSATYQRQVGAILSPGGASLRGETAITPDGDHLIALTNGGSVLVFDIGPDTLVESVSVGIDPRDVEIDATGNRAYVSHDNGDMSVVALRIDTATSFFVQTVAAGGSLRGMDITPAETYIYATDRQLDEIKIVDLDENSATWRTVITDFEQEYNPIDVKLSSDGVYGFSILEGKTATSPRLIVTTIGLGPALASVYPKYAPEGAIVVIAGQDMGVDGDIVTVDFNGVVTTPERVDGTALHVRVPIGATTGPVKTTKQSVAPGSPVEESNELFFTVLGASGPGGFRLADDIPVDVGLTVWGEIAISPDGDLAFMNGLDGEVHIISINPSRADFNQLIRVADVYDPGPLNDLDITADGKYLFMCSNVSPDIRVLSARRSDGDFAKQVLPVDIDTFSVDNPALIKTSPDNQWVLMYDSGVNAVNLIETTGLDDGAQPTIRYQASLLNVIDMVFHPSGLVAYLANTSPEGIWVLNTDSRSPFFGTLIDNEPMPTPFALPVHAPFGIDVLPDGSRLHANAYTTGGLPSHEVIEFDLPTPGTGVPSDTISVANAWLVGTGTSPFTTLPLRISPRGDRAVWSQDNWGLAYYVVGGDAGSLLSTTALDDVVDHYDFEFTPDGTRVCIASETLNSLVVYDFVEAHTLSITSGNYQSGVINQQLAAPLRVKVSSTAGGSLAGVALEFETTNGGFLTTSGTTPNLVVATDEDGYAEAAWVLGPTTGSQMCQVVGSGLSGSPLLFSANAVEDPATLPLHLSQVIPVNNTGGHSVTTAVQATFSRGVVPSTVSDTTLWLREATGSTHIPVAYGFTDGDRKVSLTPINPLEYGSPYEITFTASIKDTSDGALDNPTSTKFSTQGSPPPPNISALNPPSGVTGINLTISGSGFDPVPGNNTVLFNGAQVTPFAGSVDFLKVLVPKAAITGEVFVATASDTSNGRPFTVLVPTTSPIDDVIATIGVGGGTRTLSVTPDGSVAYTVSTDGDVVIPISVDSLQSGDAIGVGDQPVAISIHPEGTYAYVANFGSGSLTIIDIDPGSPDHNTVDQTLLVGTNPLDVISTDDRVFVANAGSNNVSIVDSDSSSATHHAVIATIGIGGGARTLSVSPDGTRLYVGNDTGYIVMQVSSYAVIATIGIGGGARSLTVSPDGTLMYVLTNSGDVVVYNVEPNSVGENSVIATIGIGGGARSLTVSPDGSLLYLVQENSDQIIVIEVTVVGGASALESPGFALAYSVKDTVVTGQDPAKVAFDPSGSGVALIAQAGETDVIILNASPFPQGPLAADVKVRPNTLNLDSNGKYVTGRIELPIAYAPQEIKIETVELQDTIPAVPDKFEYEDEDMDGVDELVVKFDRSDFQAILPEGEYVEVSISGMVRDKMFSGLDTIRTIRPTVTAPHGGQHIPPLSVFTVAWDSPDGYAVHHADVHFSADDGVTWSAIAEGIPDAGYVAWMTPGLVSTQCRIMVILYTSEDEVLGMGMSQEPFAVATPLSVALTSFDISVEEGTALMRWKTGAEIGMVGFHLVRSNEMAGEYVRVTEEMIPARGGLYGGSYEYRDETVRPNETYYYKLQELAENGPGLEFGPYKVEYRLTNGLLQNVPNPFNPTTAIKFSIASDQHVRLMVFDVAGRRVATLVDERRRADIYKVLWDGRNDQGQKVASGVYFYRLQAGKFNSTKKMLLLK